MGSRGRRRSDSEDDRTLFAKGLCYNTTEETLVQTFGALSARIPLNNQGRSKGFAYIEFEDEDKAEDALTNHVGIEIDGWTPALDYVGRKRKNYEESADGGGGGGGGGGGSRSRRSDDYGGRRDGGRRDGGGRDGGGRDGGGRDGGGRDGGGRDGGGRDGGGRDGGGRDGGGRDGGGRDGGGRDGGGRDGGGRRDGGRRYGGGSYGFQSGGARGRDYDSRPRGGGGRGSAQDNSQNKTVYVKNISPESDETSLMELLSCASVRIPKYRDSDEIKGFAYADFEDHASAQSAIDTMNGEEGLFLEFARERGGGGGGASGGGGGARERTDNLSEKTLYVKGISIETDEDSLADLLGCAEVRIPRDRDTDENKGFAYADFKDNASAQKAIDNLAGTDGLLLEFARERGGGRGRRGGYRGRRGGGSRGGYNGY